MKDSRMKKLKCKPGTAYLGSSSVGKALEVLLRKNPAWEYRDAGSKEATLGSKNRGRTRRSREGSPHCLALLRALLEYRSQVLALQCRKDINELEVVQGSVTGMVGLEHLPVRSWLSLEHILQGTEKQPQCLCGKAPGDDNGLLRRAVQSPPLESTIFVSFQAQTG